MVRLPRSWRGTPRDPPLVDTEAKMESYDDGLILRDGSDYVAFVGAIEDVVPDVGDVCKRKR